MCASLLVESPLRCYFVLFLQTKKDKKDAKNILHSACGSSSFVSPCPMKKEEDGQRRTKQDK